MRSEKHSRNAVRVTLPGGTCAPPRSRGACASDCCECRKGSVSSAAVFDPRRVLVPGRSPAVVADSGQLTTVYLDQAVMFVLCFDGKCVSLLSEIFRHCL